MRKFILALFVFLCQFVVGQDFSKALTQEIIDLASRKHMPGFAVSIVDTSGVIYEHSFGYANLESKRKYTVQTPQIVASVSKTFVAFSIMKLIEAKKLSLNTPINEILPFTVVNPNHPSKQITVNELVTHTAGILDVDENYDFVNRSMLNANKELIKKLPKDYQKYMKKWSKNESLHLSEFCKSTLSASGKFYTDKGFSKEAPGMHYEYSNLGATLAAYIVEIVSGMTFQEYTKRNIFDPVGMKNTSWVAAELGYDKVATKYITPEKVPMPHFTELSFPDGGLHTSTEDLSKYLIAMMKGYLGSNELLDPIYYQTMMNPRLSVVQMENAVSKNRKNIGVFWTIDPDGDIWHSGGDVTGATVHMWFDPKTKMGRIIMTNYFVDDKESRTEYIHIWKTLEKYSDAYNK